MAPTWLKLVLVDTVSSEEVRQGDECFQRCVATFTPGGVVQAVRQVGVEADILRVGLHVTEGVFRDETELDTLHSIYPELRPPLEADRTADVSGVVVYELSLWVRAKEARGCALELATGPRVETPVGAVVVQDVSQLSDAVLPRGHAHSPVAPSRPVPLVEPAELVHGDPAICRKEGAQSEESVAVALEQQTAGSLGGEQGTPGRHHAPHRKLLMMTDFLNYYIMVLSCPTVQLT